MFKTAIFDLDGTLLNTLGDLTDASNYICAQNGWPTFTEEQIRHMVGNGNAKLVERFTPENQRTPECLARSMEQFMAYYDIHKMDRTAPYPGVAEAVAALRGAGIKTAVFSKDVYKRQIQRRQPVDRRRQVGGHRIVVIGTEENHTVRLPDGGVHILHDHAAVKAPALFPEVEAGSVGTASAVLQCAVAKADLRDGAGVSQPLSDSAPECQRVGCGVVGGVKYQEIRLFQPWRREV